MELFPPIPLREWDDTKQTLHRFLQVVGKIRLASSPRRNHWWHVPFHLTGNGVTTRPMGLADGSPVYTVDFDFVDHLLVARTIDGRSAAFTLLGHSVSSFYQETLATLEGWGFTPGSRVPRRSTWPTRNARSWRTPSTRPTTLRR